MLLHRCISTFLAGFENSLQANRLLTQSAEIVKKPVVEQHVSFQRVYLEVFFGLSVYALDLFIVGQVQMGCCGAVLYSRKSQRCWHGVCAGYWSSWQGEAVCNSKDMKNFLGIGAEDSCLGFYLVGNSERISSYRSKRSDMSDKVVWR